MKTAYSLLLIFLPLFGICQFDSTGFKLAAKFYDDKNYKAALTKVNELLSTNQKMAGYYDLRAKVYYELDERLKAIDDFSTAISLDSLNPILYHNRSMVFYSTQNPNLAIDDHNTALRFTTDDSLRKIIVLNRGAAEAMRRNFEAAYKDYMQVLQYDSTDFGALNNIGAVLDELGRREEATDILKKLIRLYPEFKGGYINLAFQYVELGKYKEALALSNKAIALDPDEPLSYNNRGYVKYKLHDLTGALADINKSLKMYPTNSYAYRNRALVYLEMKQEQKACDDLNKAVSKGFTEMYGDEVKKLLEEHCSSK